MNVITAIGRWTRLDVGLMRLTRAMQARLEAARARWTPVMRVRSALARSVRATKLDQLARWIGLRIRNHPRAVRVATLGFMGVVLAILLLWQPLPTLVLAWGGVLFLAGAFCAYRWPGTAMVLAPGIVLLAGTKFRLRDPTLSTAGSIDSQILFELALYAFIATICLLAWVACGAQRRRSKWTELSLVLFGLFALTSAYWSPIPVLSAVRAGQLVVLVGLAYLAVRLLGPIRAVGTMSTSLVVYVLTCAAIAIIAPGTVVSDSGINPGRFAWFATHPIMVATLSGLAGIVVVARGLFGVPAPRRLRGALHWLWFLPLVAVLGATHSRAAMVALAVAIGALLLRRFTPTWMATALICAAVGVLALFPIVDLTPVDLLQRMEGAEGPLAEFIFRGQTAEEVMTLNGRLELWGALGSLIAERPVFGYGYLSSRELVIGLISWARMGGYAHNEVAQTLLDFGLIGTLLFWMAFMTGFLPGSLCRSEAEPEVIRTRATIFGAAVYLLVNAMSSEGLVAPPGFGMLMVCIIVFAAAHLRDVRPSSWSNAP